MHFSLKTKNKEHQKSLSTGRVYLYCFATRLHQFLGWLHHLAQWDLNYLVSYRKSCWSITLIVHADRVYCLVSSKYPRSLERYMHTRQWEIH